MNFKGYPHPWEKNIENWKPYAEVQVKTNFVTRQTLKLVHKIGSRIIIQGARKVLIVFMMSSTHIL